MDISDKEIKDLLIREKLTDVQAAFKLKVSKSTIARRRQMLKIKPKPKRPEGYFDLNEEQEEQLKKLYQEGKNDYEVAAIMHLGRNRLRAWRENNKIPSKTNKKNFDYNDAVKMYHLYQEGKTLSEISAIYKVSVSSIGKHLRKNLFVIPGKRPTENILETKLDYHQEQVLIGDLFGDGGLFLSSKNSDKAYYYTRHANKQDFFLIWKYQLLDNIILNVNSRKKDQSVRVYSWSLPYLKRWYDIFYPNNKKELTKDLIQYMGPISLAVWYMGDGSLNKRVPTIHVNLDVKMYPIARELSKKFNILFEAIPYKKEWHLKVKDSTRFFKLITPYCIRGFEYKIFEEYHKFIEESWKGVKEGVENILEFYIKYYRKRGFPYPSYNKRELKQDFNALKKATLFSEKDLFINNKCGSKICNHYFPHRFDGRRFDSNPMLNWNDDKKFRAFIRNRLRYSDRITDSTIRTGIQLKGVPANFSPLLAKYIYERYLKNKGITLDFSAGYGGRLVGFLASKNPGTYIGYEPYSKSYQSLKNLSEDSFELSGCKKQIKLFNEPFEDMNRRHKVDLIFSSPPYFGLEIYTDESTQSIIRYPNYDQWLQGFWIELVEKVYPILSESGFFIYSIGNYLKFNMIKDTQEILKDRGFVLKREIKMHYMNVYQKSKRYEYIFVYIKK